MISISEFMGRFTKLAELPDDAPIPWTVGEFRRLVDSLAVMLPAAKSLQAAIKHKPKPEQKESGK